MNKEICGALVSIVNVINSTEMDVREILYGEGYDDNEIELIEKYTGMDFEDYNKREDEEE